MKKTGMQQKMSISDGENRMCKSPEAGASIMY